MYTVKFFVPEIMTHPCEHRFRSLNNAKNYAKQVTNVCKEKHSAYSMTIFTKGRTVLEEKWEG